MLVFTSFVLIILFTIYACTNTRSKKQWISSTMGKCISMALGMGSSTMMGLLLARLLPGELAYSTVLSIVVSGILAYFIGKPYSVPGIIEALSASFMGAMMGAMLGDMTPENRVTFILVAMDMIYLLSVIVLMAMVNKEAVKQNGMKGTKLSPILLSLILSFSLIGIATIIGKSAVDGNKSMNMEMNHEHHH